jgi:arylsulfatase A-like enzyme
MLTSLYPTDHGAYAHAWGAEFRLDPSIVTLADLMREASYVSGAITGGAWVSGKFGFAKGFDIYTDNAMYKDDYPENVFGQVKNWIKNNSHHQFFLFLHSYEIHSPYAPPPPYTNMFAEGPLKWTSVIETEFILNRRGQNPLLNEQEKENFIALYDGEIRYTDERLIKPIIEELKRLKLYDSTMIILTSDHGEEFLEHGGLGHTRVLYEESLRVPLIIKFPHSGHRGTRVPNAVRVVDILPSILDILGLDYSSFQFEGQSVLGLLKSGAKDSRISVGYKFAPLYTEQHQFGYILRYISENMDGSKLIWKEEIQRRNKIPPGIELYDLLKDPGEKNNLAESELSLAQELIEKLNPYYREASKIKEGVIKTVVEDKSLEERLRALGYIK